MSQTDRSFKYLTHTVHEEAQRAALQAFTLQSGLQIDATVKIALRTAVDAAIVSMTESPTDLSVGDNQPRYTTKRMHDEISKAKVYGIEMAAEAVAAFRCDTGEFLPRDQVIAAIRSVKESPSDQMVGIVPPHCAGYSFVFEPGVLHVKKDGSGHIVVNEEDFTLEDDRCEGPDGPEGSVHWIARLDASEIVALRDFLNGASSPGNLAAENDRLRKAAEPFAKFRTPGKVGTYDDRIRQHFSPDDFKAIRDAFSSAEEPQPMNQMVAANPDIEKAAKWHERRAEEAMGSLHCGSENWEYREAGKTADMHRLAAKAIRLAKLEDQQ